LFCNSLLIITFVLIDNQRVAIVDCIKIDKNIAYISYLENISKQQIRKIRCNIELYIFVVASQYCRDFAKLINKTIKNSFLKYIDLYSIVYLDEMCLYLYNKFDIIVNIWTIAKMFQKKDKYIKKLI